MQKIRFDITGMSCSACSTKVETTVNKIDGANATVNLLSNSMTVLVDEKKTTATEIISAVESIGYTAALHEDTATKKAEIKSDSALIKLIISVALLIPLMIIGMGHMYGLHIDSTANIAIQIILTAGIIGLNFKYFTNGFKGLVHLSPNMDSLIALGATASVVYSIVAIFTADNYMHNLYFESAGMILTFVSVGKYFEAKSKSKTTKAISGLIDLSPDTTRIERDNKVVVISTDDVNVGDTVVIKSGDRISVDGVIIEGNGFSDESALTGESMPVEKDIDDKVYCGTVLTSGFIKVKAQKVKSDTTLSKIISLVEEASSSKAPIAKIADKVSRFFVPAVIAMAIITTVAWNLYQNSFAVSLSFGIAVLVISCPCALGLATPTAIMVSTGVAAVNSILIKSSESLEVLSKAKNIVFDKTGTITQGKPLIVDIQVFDKFEKAELMKIAASLEARSQHPMAVAVMEEYNSDDYYDVDNFESITSMGISGVINGRSYRIGNRRFANPDNKHIPDNSYTNLCISEDDRLVGIISVADKVKESSIYAINKLNKMGIDTYMLTGDNKYTAQDVQSKTGIKHVYYNLMPDDKQRIVRELKEKGTTIMVGDGINDSPALVTADVGIAIGAGTDIAIDSADIILTKSDLSDVLTAVELSKATLKNIKENLFWAFFYNIIFIPIAAGMLYVPFGIRLEAMYGTIAMSLSSICVVSNALRLRLFKPKHIDNNYINTTVKEEQIKMKTMIIDGMMCEHCKSHVEKALNSIEGVSANVDLSSKSATITGDVEDKVLIKAVTDAGYTVVEIK